MPHEVFENRDKCVGSEKVDGMHVSSFVIKEVDITDQCVPRTYPWDGPVRIRYAHAAGQSSDQVQVDLLNVGETGESGIRVLYVGELRTNVFAKPLMTKGPADPHGCWRENTGFDKRFGLTVEQAIALALEHAPRVPDPPYRGKVLIARD